MPAHRAVRVAVDELGLNHHKPHKNLRKAKTDEQSVHVPHEVPHVVEAVEEQQLSLNVDVAPSAPTENVVEPVVESTPATEVLAETLEEKPTGNNKKKSKKVTE